MLFIRFRSLNAGALLCISLTAGCSLNDSKVGVQNSPVAPGSSCDAPGETAPSSADCNTCSCSSDRVWTCTDIACACRQGASRPAGDGCNTCHCNGGEWECTLVGCAACQEGTTKPAGDGCNTCSCQGGQWLCSNIGCGCSEGEQRPSDDGCNECTCSSGQWVCTDRACPQCVAGEVRARGDDCNGCSCLENGEWLCSNFKCDELCPLARHTSDVCPPVEIWAKDPTGMRCCRYSDPCRAPESWTRHDSVGSCWATP